MNDIKRLSKAMSANRPGKAINMPSANLQDANLSYKNLQGANLRGADMRGANLRGADMRGADLRGADLRNTILNEADLRNAILYSADLRDAKLPHFQICPEEGAFIAYKKVHGAVLTLRIPAEAKRTSSLVGRKCRAEYVEVLASSTNAWPGTIYEGRYDRTRYIIGDRTYADSFDPDIRVECTHGIHFFMTRKEAEAY